MAPHQSQKPNLEMLAKENAQLRGDLLTIGRRVSHDLRTPLGGISMSIELLRELLAKNDAASDALQSLECSADELSRLIKSLSVLAKATAHPQPMENVAMGEIVWGVVQQLERRALKRGATVKAPEVWPRATGHPGWLEFIWWNLLANALQYGGLVIQLDWAKEKERLRFWIRDNGPASPLTRARFSSSPLIRCIKPTAAADLACPSFAGWWICRTAVVAMK